MRGLFQLGRYVVGRALRRSRPLPPRSCGAVRPGWEPVENAFREVLKTHPHHGYAYSVYHKGEKVVDLYGGFADYARSEPYRENTLTLMLSCTKVISAICVAMLVDRGHLDYKEKVSRYWPEFAANGKQDVTVDMLLSCQAGVYTLNDGFSLFEILENPKKLSRQLAEEKPAWEPGTKHGYHAVTLGLYMDELVRHTDPRGRTIWEFFREELAEPLNLDIHYGLPLADFYRGATVERSFLSCAEDWRAFFLDYGWWHMYRMRPGVPLTVGKQFSDITHRKNYNNPHSRSLPIASFVADGTARDVAKLMGVVATGGRHGGRNFLSPETARLLTEVLTSGREEIFQIPGLFQFGRGTMPLKSPLGSWMFGFPGTGGQLAYGDLDHGLGFAFLTNRLYGGLNAYSPQGRAMVEATYDVLRTLMQQDGSVES